MDLSKNRSVESEILGFNFKSSISGWILGLRETEKGDGLMILDGAHM